MALRERFDEALRACPVVAIFRWPEAVDVVPLFGALVAGGVRLFEVTMNTPGAGEAVAAVRAARDARGVGDGLIGAGTVLDAATAKRAVAAGAEFLVTPTVDEATIGWAVDAGVPVLAGAFTPTEIRRAWTAGAAAVKVFPADALGPGYIRDVLAPLGGGEGGVRLVPTGNIALDDVRAYLDAGAVGVGVGPTLIDPDDVRHERWDAVTAAARRWAEAARG